MPQSQNRSDLNKLGSKNPPYFLLFTLSLVFITASLFAYNYTSGRLSKQLAVKNINDIYSTPTSTPAPIKPTIEPEPTTASGSQSAQALTPTITPTPTPLEPYLQTFTSQDQNFKVDYMSTRTAFQDDSSIASRFVFVNPLGNFVVHVGNKDYAWTHSGRTFSDKLLIQGKQTFVFDTTSQKVVDLKTDDGFFYTLQCVHNGNDDLVSECLDFIQSFAFLNQN